MGDELAETCRIAECPHLAGWTCYGSHDARCRIEWMSRTHPEDWGDDMESYTEYADRQPVPAGPVVVLPRGRQPRRTTRAQRRAQRG